MSVTHKQRHELTFSNGTRVSFTVEDGLLTFVSESLGPGIDPIPIAELEYLVTAANSGNGNKQQRRHRRQSAVAADVMLRWNKKWIRNPSVKFRKETVQRTVVDGCYKLCKRPLARRELESQLVSKSSLSYRQVQAAVSRMIHKTHMLEVCG